MPRAVIGLALAPEARVEAFVIGLMLDAGIPLLHKMEGDAVLERTGRV